MTVLCGTMRQVGRHDDTAASSSVTESFNISENVWKALEAVENLNDMLYTGSKESDTTPTKNDDPPIQTLVIQRSAHHFEHSLAVGRATRCT